MKILRLDLRAYAQFSHKKIEFDPAKKIHVIYGQNEAGKSSFTRAFRALLFGIEKKSKDSFKHSDENLFIEGLLESKAGKMIQISRDSKSSRRENQKLINYTSNLDRKSYSSLFCLNQDSILMGSKDLIENLRHFDQSLFSSIQGSQAASALIKSIEEDLENLYKSRGTKPSVNQKIFQLSTLLEEKKNSILTQSVWSNLSGDEMETEKEIAKLDKKAFGLIEKEKDLEILYDIYAFLSEYNQLEHSLSSFDSSKILKEKDLYLIQENECNISEIRKRKEKLIFEIAKIKDDLSFLSFDLRLINLKRTVESLIESYSEYLESKIYIEQIRKELEVKKGEFKLINLVLQEKINSSLSKTQWLEIKKCSDEICANIKITNNLVNVKSDKLNIYLDESKDIDQKLEAFNGQNDQDGKLEQFLNSIGEYEDLEIRLEEKNKSIKILKNRVSSEIIHFDYQKWKSIKSEIKKLNLILVEYQKIKDLISLYETKLSNIAATKINDNGFSLTKYQDLKAKRKSISKDLLIPWKSNDYKEKFLLFKKYQSLIDEEDAQEDYLVENIDQVANIKKAFDDRKDFEKEVETHQLKLKPILSIISSFLEKTTLGFVQLSDEHCKYLVYNLSDLEGLCTLLSEQEELQEKINFFKNLISTNLSADVSSASFVKIKTLINEKLEKLFQAKKCRISLLKRLEYLKESIQELRNELKSHGKEINKLKSKWIQIEKKYQIKVSFNSEEISNLIKNVDSFFELSETIKLKSELIKEKIRFVESFENNMKKVSAFTDIKPENIPKVQKLILNEELKKEKSDKLTFLVKEKEKELDQVNDHVDNLVLEQGKILNQIQENLTIGKEELIKESIEHYSVKSRFEKLKRTLDLKCSPKKLKHYIQISKSYSNFEFIENNLESLKMQIIEVKNNRSLLEKKLGEIQYQKKKFNDFSKRYLLDDNLQSCIYELDDEIQKYLISKVSYTLVKKFIWNYQEKHQHDILKKASNIFQQLTNGKYTKIQLNILNQKESFLVCTNCSNQQVTVDVLSEGTRDQLFISLKFAMLQLYGIKNEAIPIILDDLLVNFDDQRAVSTLNFLNHFQFDSQIILLTHHMHILEFVHKHLNDSCYQIHTLNDEFAINA